LDDEMNDEMRFRDFQNFVAGEEESSSSANYFFVMGIPEK